MPKFFHPETPSCFDQNFENFCPNGSDVDLASVAKPTIWLVVGPILIGEVTVGAHQYANNRELMFRPS